MRPAGPDPNDPGYLASHAPRSAAPSIDAGPLDTVTLSGAGDIARCDGEADEATARLLDDLPGFVFTAGDNAYEHGSARDFALCYGPSWGRHRDRTFPALGNHDLETRGAAGYFNYFGEWAGGREAGWYALDLGGWRLIVLNSLCSSAGGCGPESAQGRWLADELAANPRTCTVAIWHHPLFTTGDHGPTRAARQFWEPLHAAGVELVVNGHEHNYERFVPLEPGGSEDPTRGIRQFVVGTGGGELRGFPRDAPTSAARHSGHGVLRLDLFAGGYSWEFVPVEPGDFTDAGRGTCH